ncbi:hypothetical protein H696_04086 [Fonticula alba]|uniref:Peptidase S8/S53 domain-containing protein n=1 Tax=Fonticula alba TaxID=691883 RepID=A0A058Z6W6_FONAL|nr:hypothetical protein H696_04086 [Fonticula alba]KCV69678.1 hypothetical protein H696_04086 [Fonticula alba]|eukprot:XP_009496243.1 hypothetical protein H696_04086 [Fonticula alba]
MGTMVGSKASGIGVAPGAKWISAKGCKDKNCKTYGLTKAAEWMVCPYADNLPPRCDLGADIINNSWGGTHGFDPFFALQVRAFLEADIVPIFSSGNSGPLCGTTGSPGDQILTLSVGATDSRDALADFSARGPGPRASGFDRLKPNVVAPGVAIRSAYSTRGGLLNNRFAAISGTSMAAPAVAGVAALVRSVNPALRVEDIYRLLEDTAVRSTITAPAPSRLGTNSCDGVHWVDFPNYHYGYGRVDALAAVRAAQRRLRTSGGA